MDQITIALEKVDILPPDRVTDNTSVLTLKNLMLEPLVGWDSGHATPGLFSHWIQQDGGRRWQLFIRPGATFHDGKPCEPEDILAVIDGLLASVDTFGMKWSYARYLAEARLEPGPDRSVIVENPEPFADILDIFSEFYVSRLNGEGRATLGTGPFRVAAHEAGRTVDLERVAPPAGDGPKRIRLVAVPHAEERWRMLVDGAVDAAIHLDHLEHPPLDDGHLIWGRRLSPLSVMAYLNCSAGPFVSAQARLAANLAIDRQALVRDVFHGLAEPASTIVSPAHLGMQRHRLPPLPFDPDRARALLAASGVDRTITFRTPTFMPERAPEITRFTAESLQAVGFEVTIETEHNRPEYARQVGRKQIGDCALFDSSPHSTFRVLNDKIASGVKAVWWQGYHNEDVERLIGIANRAVDQEAREQAYGACLRQLQNDPPWLYLAHPVNLFAAKPGRARIALTAKGTLQIG